MVTVPAGCVETAIGDASTMMRAEVMSREEVEEGPRRLRLLPSRGWVLLEQVVVVVVVVVR